MGIQPRKIYHLRLKDSILALGERTLLMGVVNVTPDSFSDGGRFFEQDAALTQAMELIEAGADILDIGGESTRPYAEPVPVDVELQRVLPLIEGVRRFSDIPISIDTVKAEVARQAIAAGVDIVNDVTSLQADAEMVKLVAATGVPVILMHMQGSPETMQVDPHYSSLFSEIIAFLENRIQFATENGVKREQVVVDPGIGFGKTIAHNLMLVRELERFQALNRPILLGASRKRFIGAILNRPVEDREVGTAVIHSFAIAAGVHLLRVHDVALHRQVALMGDALRNGHGHESECA
jgi:dihydropteroate synthase